jgi:hypothetical protein
MTVLVVAVLALVVGIVVGVFVAGSRKEPAPVAVDPDLMRLRAENAALKKSTVHLGLMRQACLMNNDVPTRVDADRLTKADLDTVVNRVRGGMFVDAAVVADTQGLAVTAEGNERGRDIAAFGTLLASHNDPARNVLIWAVDVVGDDHLEVAVRPLPATPYVLVVACKGQAPQRTILSSAVAYAGLLVPPPPVAAGVRLGASQRAGAPGLVDVLDERCKVGKLFGILVTGPDVEPASVLMDAPDAWASLCTSVRSLHAAAEGRLRQGVRRLDMTLPNVVVTLLRTDSIEVFVFASRMVPAAEAERIVGLVRARATRSTTPRAA